MKFIIGGYAQGKRNYVLEKYQLPQDRVWDGVLPDIPISNDVLLQDKTLPPKPIVIDHFQIWVRNRMLDGGCPEKEIMTFLDRCADCIIISDEIGNGIVPVEPFEREYRERVGRLAIWLAKEAEEVERVICGIGQKIK